MVGILLFSLNVQTFHDKHINFGSLPTGLRKAMTEKFTDFDEYQLAKYNKQKSRVKKGKKDNVRLVVITVRIVAKARERGGSFPIFG